MKHFKLPSACLAFILLSSVALAAQEGEESVGTFYGLGDQIFSINAGALIPLFFMGVDASDGGLVEPALGHIGVGATGSLRWSGFLTNEINLGVEVGGMFSSSVLKRTLVSVPIIGLLSYTFRFYPFEVPVFAGLGINFLKLDSDLVPKIIQR